MEDLTPERPSFVTSQGSQKWDWAQATRGSLCPILPVWPGMRCWMTGWLFCLLLGALSFYRVVLLSFHMRAWAYSYRILLCCVQLISLDRLLFSEVKQIWRRKFRGETRESGGRGGCTCDRRIIVENRKNYPW